MSSPRKYREPKPGGGPVAALLIAALIVSLAGIVVAVGQVSRARNTLEPVPSPTIDVHPVAEAAAKLAKRAQHDAERFAAGHEPTLKGWAAPAGCVVIAAQAGTFESRREMLAVQLKVSRSMSAPFAVGNGSARAEDGTWHAATIVAQCAPETKEDA